MEFHPLADLFPLMSETEFDGLCTDIAANGLREAIWTHEDMIVDGRNRYNACRKLGIDPAYRKWNEEGSLVSFVVSLNLNRRHLSESQRAMVAVKIANLEKGDNQYKKEVPPIGGTISQSDAAKMLNVSERSIQRAAKVQKEGVTELVEKVESGEITVTAAAKIAELPKGKQKRLIKRGRKAAQSLRTRLMTRSLEAAKAVGSLCLHCDPKAVFTAETVSAFMQELAFKSPPFARLFNDVVEELEGENLSETLRDGYAKIFAAIDLGFTEHTDLQRASKMAKDEFDATLTQMLDYGMVEPFRQGGKTEVARGAAKILYRRVEKEEVRELEYELVADEF